MSATQISFDEYSFSGPQTPSSYELQAALGVPQYSSLYPHSHLDASTSGAHPGGHIPQMPSDAMYSSFFPENDDQVTAQQYLSGASAAFLDSQLQHYGTFPYRPPSPQRLYNPPSAWHPSDGYGAAYNPSTSAAFLQNLQSVIESSHTVQTQHANHLAQAAQQQQVAGSSQPSWTLSGSLDPTTGIFQRTVEHPRLRTAQACEKCRIRKAKCSGEQPCQRCVSRGLQCEYAPERKMRGPNKHKRKSSNAPKPLDDIPSPRRRPRGSSVSSILSSSEDGHVSEGQSDGSPAMLPVEDPVPVPVLGHSSVHSSPAPGNRPLPEVNSGGRPRAATVGSRPAFRVSITPASIGAQVHSRPRPPPLNLSSARDYVPRMLAQYARSADQVGFPADVPGASGRTSRPTSLPPYLLESYSRIALSSSAGDGKGHGPHDVSQFLQNSPAEGLSVFSHTRSNSNSNSNSSDMSAPITPISLTFEGPGELQLPSDDTPAFDHYLGQFGDGAPEQPFEVGGSGLHVYPGPSQDVYRPKSAEEVQPAWGMRAMQSQIAEDVDGTPRGVNDVDMTHVVMHAS